MDYKQRLIAKKLKFYQNATPIECYMKLVKPSSLSLCRKIKDLADNGNKIILTSYCNLSMKRHKTLAEVSYVNKNGELCHDVLLDNLM